jgi:AraC-like DNA-binding protein
MSRSSFCERFAALAARAPLRYQSELRRTLAREMLAKPNARVGEVGLSVGYKSEAAFSRAYKAFFGHPLRQAQGNGAAVSPRWRVAAASWLTYAHSGHSRQHGLAAAIAIGRVLLPGKALRQAHYRQRRRSNSARTQ